MTDHVFYTLSISTAAALLAYIVLWSGLQTFNANPINRFVRVWGKLVLYYAAYTMPVWSALLLIGWTQGMLEQQSLLVSIVIVLMVLYFYTVVIQPSRLRIEHHNIDLDLSVPMTVAVLADLRIGLYSGKPRHIRKLVTTINALSVDAVLITGDWLYYPSADLVGQLMLFKGINKPVYTVMSDSDLRYQSMNTTNQGQPPLEDTLAKAFDVLDISYIGQQCTTLPLKCVDTVRGQSLAQNMTHHKHHQANIKPDGLGDKQVVAILCGWQSRLRQLADSQVSHASDTADKAVLSTEVEQTSKPIIMLDSQYDSIGHLPSSSQLRTLLITGADKVIYKNIGLAKSKKEVQPSSEQPILLSNSPEKKQYGLYQHGSTHIFVSGGIGTRGLPFRLYQPTIDVLTIR